MNCSLHFFVNFKQTCIAFDMPYLKTLIPVQEYFNNGINQALSSAIVASPKQKSENGDSIMSRYLQNWAKW